MSEEVEKLYISQEKIEFEVGGVKFKCKEISGDEYMTLLEGCLAEDGQTLKRDVYAQKLVNAVLVEPEGLDVSRLKPAIYAVLISELETNLGMSEAYRKKLEER